MDFIAGLIELTGNWLVGRGSRWGFCCNLLSCIIWTCLAFAKPMWGLLVVVLPSLLLNAYNFKRWSRGAKLSGGHVLQTAATEAPVAQHQERACEVGDQCVVQLEPVLAAVHNEGFSI